jgi:hypothetical protein
MLTLHFLHKYAMQRLYINAKLRDNAISKAKDVCLLEMRIKLFGGVIIEISLNINNGSSLIARA